MARPRKFDTDEALTDAMNVFWQHGYDAASLPELLKGMGLTRGSFYKAFVDKKTLFLSVLDRYETEAVEPVVLLLRNNSVDGVERISTFFESVVHAVRNGDQRGCLLCSAAAGPATVDAEVAELVHLQLRKMKLAFEQALAQSATYEHVNNQEREEMASLLLSQYVGLRVLVRSNASIETIQRSVCYLRRVLSNSREQL